jgi:hypothetical protein
MGWGGGGRGWFWLNRKRWRTGSRRRNIVFIESRQDSEIKANVGGTGFLPLPFSVAIWSGTLKNRFLVSFHDDDMPQ